MTLFYLFASFLVDENDGDKNDNFDDNAEKRPNCSVATFHSNKQLKEKDVRMEKPRSAS